MNAGFLRNGLNTEHYERLNISLPVRFIHESHLSHYFVHIRFYVHEPGVLDAS